MGTVINGTTIPSDNDRYNVDKDNTYFKPLINAVTKLVPQTVSKSADYTIVLSDLGMGVTTFLTDTTSGDVTYTLTAIATVGTQRIEFIKVAGANNIILDGYSTETIDGSTTKTITNSDPVLIFSNGTEWRSGINSLVGGLFEYTEEIPKANLDTTAQSIGLQMLKGWKIKETVVIPTTADGGAATLNVGGDADLLGSADPDALIISADLNQLEPQSSDSSLRGASVVSGFGSVTVDDDGYITYTSAGDYTSGNFVGYIKVVYTKG